MSRLYVKKLLNTLCSAHRALSHSEDYNFRAICILYVRNRILNISLFLQMQQRNSVVVDMESKLTDMKSKSDEYTDKVFIYRCETFVRLLVPRPGCIFMFVHLTTLLVIIFSQLEHCEDTIRELNLKMTSLQGERDQKTHEVRRLSNLLCS